MSASGWKRIFLGNAQDVEIDSAARVLVAPELRAAAGLSKDVMLLGMGSHFELWDAQRYAAHEAEVMAQAMPDALQDFSFLTRCNRPLSPLQHRTVLLHEAVEALWDPAVGPHPQGVYVDATFGRGGHSRLILSRLGPEARLIALDRDPDAIAHATQGPDAITDPRFQIVHAPFSSWAEVIADLGLGPVQGLLDGHRRVLAPDRQPRAGFQFPFRCAAGHAHGHHPGRERGRFPGPRLGRRTDGGDSHLWRRTVCLAHCKGACRSSR